MTATDAHRANLQPALRDRARVDAAAGAATRRTAGLAALTQGGTFVVGMVMFATTISAWNGYREPGTTASGNVALVAESPVVLQTWYAVIFLVFGVALVAGTVALHGLLRVQSPGWARAQTVLGTVWATLMFAVGMTAIAGVSLITDLAERSIDEASATWLSLDLLLRGMGGGIELVGGLWVAAASIGALRAGLFPRALNYLGLAVGMIGVFTTTLLVAEEATAAFGVGVIVWYIGTGVSLLRRARQA